MQRDTGAKTGRYRGGLPKQLERAFASNSHIVSPLISLSLKSVALRFAKHEYAMKNKVRLKCLLQWSDRRPGALRRNQGFKTKAPPGNRWRIGNVFSTLEK
jgi:hypothetical protein